MDNIRKVLASYRINAVTIDHITDNLLKISDSHHSYALKISKLTSETIVNWENVYHQSYKQNISSILPVYLTEQGKSHEKINDTFYYLTPWLSSNPIEPKQQIERMYRSIGTIHTQTRQSLAMDSEKVINSFERYQAQLKKNRLILLQYVEKFEKNRYMSPVELLVCTQYRDLEFVFDELMNRIEQFVYDLQNQSVWYYSLCHGQLDFSHIIYDHHTHIINWEKSHFNNAAVDLAGLFHNVTKQYDDPAEHLVDMFFAYIEENKLTETELCLLSIHLLDPTKYITIVEQYIKNTTAYSEVDQIKQLQHCHRQLSYAVKWTAYTDTITESIDESES
ncbi:hypothetical protein [Lentibacillus sp. Marseille-P4043]|uniref:hypothetical protein n=1 Tax=Lentibacillus sp. Marseille-P4043 TaxID=2040293 RepID=UPI000D0B2EE3|nr:hypothetical protein [Lentibacillus sp. Marseille-P4043]